MVSLMDRTRTETGLASVSRRWKKPLLLPCFAAMAGGGVLWLSNDARLASLDGVTPATAATAFDSADCHATMMSALVIEADWTALNHRIAEGFRLCSPDLTDADAVAASHAAAEFLRLRCFSSPADYVAAAMVSGLVPSPLSVEPDGTADMLAAVGRVTFGEVAHNQAIGLLASPITAVPFLATGRGTIAHPPVLGVVDAQSDPHALEVHLWHTEAVASGTREFCTVGEAHAGALPPTTPTLGFALMIAFPDGSRAPVHCMLARAGVDGAWTTVGYWRFADCDGDGLDGSFLSF